VQPVEKVVCHCLLASSACLSGFQRYSAALLASKQWHTFPSVSPFFNALPGNRVPRFLERAIIDHARWKERSSVASIFMTGGNETHGMSEIDPEILARLLDAHGAVLVLYARQWCDAPEDVVQEAWVSLVRQPAIPENVVGWLYRVVRNGAISARRAESRRRRREAAVSRRDPPWFVSSAEAAIDAEAATEALRGLPVEQREIIVARLWGGLPLEQIAAVAGCSTSTAHRRYQAGLSALRERLGVSCPKTKNSRRD